jgi:hypothetical protein
MNGTKMVRVIKYLYITHQKYILSLFHISYHVSQFVSLTYNVVATVLHYNSSPLAKKVGCRRIECSNCSTNRGSTGRGIAALADDPRRSIFRLLTNQNSTRPVVASIALSNCSYFRSTKNYCGVVDHCSNYRHLPNHTSGDSIGHLGWKEVYIGHPRSRL